MAGKHYSRRDFLMGWLQSRADQPDAPPHPPPTRQPAGSRPVERAAAPPPFLRPPGAGDEATFLATCSRGGDCAMACPVHALVPLGPAYGEAAEGTPAFFPRASACVLCADLPCIAACPSGALGPVAIPALRMGLAELDRLLCLAAQGTPCDDCVVACPVGSSALRLVDGVPEVEPRNCSGCGRCEQVCPTHPSAITVRPFLTDRIRAPASSV